MTNLSGAVWHKAMASYANGGCVEVAANLGDAVAIRDSTRIEDGAHIVTPSDFTTLLADVKRGRFDISRRQEWRTAALPGGRGRQPESPNEPESPSGGSLSGIPCSCGCLEAPCGLA